MNRACKPAPFVIPGAEQWDVTSRSGRRYRIMTWFPVTPPPDSGFPVIYILDANAVFGSLVETIRLLCRGPHGIVPFAAVGIGYPTDQPLDRNGRFFDFTVEAGEHDPPPGKDRADWPPTGGAPLFLAWIEEELKPWIERLMPVDRSRQMLLGHSLGGLFVLYTLFAKREAFRFYAAGSPSIWWKRYDIVTRARRWIDVMVSAPPAETYLFLAAGEQEKPHMIQDASQMAGLLSASGIPGLTIEHCCFAGEDHLSVVSPFLVRSIRWAARYL